MMASKRRGQTAVFLIATVALSFGAGGRAHGEMAGAGTNWLVLAERLEYQSNEGSGLFIWDAQGWWGGDYDKLWIKTEGEKSLDGGGLEEAELQALYSRAIASFWDLQIGVRHDFKPDPSRTFGVFGIQGLAPYWFEIDAAAFISEKGDVSARLEAEYEFLLTQRLIFQPRFETNLAIQDDAATGVGSGVNDIELGARLRYEIRREIAPYVGVSWSKKLGETSDFAQANGEDSDTVSFVAGLRLWF